MCKLHINTLLPEQGLMDVQFTLTTGFSTHFQHFSPQMWLYELAPFEHTGLKPQDSPQCEMLLRFIVNVKILS